MWLYPPKRARHVRVCRTCRARRCSGGAPRMQACMRARHRTGSRVHKEVRNAWNRVDRRSVGRRRQGQGDRSDRHQGRLCRPLQWRQQRGPHGGGRRRIVRAAPAAQRHHQPECHAGDWQRRGGGPGGTLRGDRRPGIPRPGLLPPAGERVGPDHRPVPSRDRQGDRTFPGQAQDRHHRPRHRPGLRGQDQPRRHPRARPVQRRAPA